jgi:two-component system LytT family response regulator
MKAEKIRVLIADDEPLARRGLKKLLAAGTAMEIVAECEDGIQAVERINELSPDIVFLDIQMPGLDGFGVIDAVGAGEMPVTIFVTAYDLHAMRAFDVHAVDYLLKPVTAERLSIAVERAVALLEKGDRVELEKKVEALINTMRPPGGKLSRFVIRSVGKVTIVPVEEVDWIEAEGDYVNLHTPRKVHLHREKMSSLEKNLDPSVFIRIHRSTIVRIARIRELRPLVNGDHVVILHSGEQLSLSRTMREKVFAALRSAG